LDLLCDPTHYDHEIKDYQPPQRLYRAIPTATLLNSYRRLADRDAIIPYHGEPRPPFF
jgi:hypothetical protein